MKTMNANIAAELYKCTNEVVTNSCGMNTKHTNFWNDQRMCVSVSMCHRNEVESERLETIEVAQVEV